jgi:hypothetical protein
VIYALTDGVTIAIVVGFTTLAATASPLLLARIMNKANRESKERDWARQDQVASRLEAASARQEGTQAALVEGQHAANVKLLAVEEQNKVIHALVNSAYTASLAAQLGALEGQLTLSRELAMMKGGEGTMKDQDAMDLIESKVYMLRSLIADRERQQKIVETQLADAHARQVQIDDPGHPNRRRGDPADALPVSFTAEVTMTPNPTTEPSPP